tara:strand:- start:263 stop:625 length:363 start_codon:yes stop_codon:yes gene_type:complete
MNYLYFASAAPDGTTSTEEVIMISADKVSHYEMRNATDLRIFLKETVGQEVLGGDGDDFAVIALDITSGKHKEVMEAIAKAANNPLSFDGGFVTIADSENNSFCTPHITACASIAVVDAA